MRNNLNRKLKQINLHKIMLKNIRQENGGIYLVPSRWYLILLMAILFVADFLVMYAGITKIIYGSVIACISFSAVISVILVAGPLVTVSLLMIKDKKRIHMVLAVILILLILQMFICLSMLSMGSETMEECGFKGLFAVVPIGNSLICMIITLLDATTVSRINRRVEKYAVRLQEYIGEQEAVVQELEEALKQDMYKESEELYNEAVNEVKAREDMIKMEVRKIVAEYLADAKDAADIFRKI